LNISSDPLPELDPVLMEQLKASRFEPLFEQLKERLDRLEKENRLLRELRRLELLKKYGASGEQLCLEQLELLELEPGVSQEEVKAERDREQLQLPLKAARKHPGRQPLPAHLPRLKRSSAALQSNASAASAVKKPV
jgi:hypothetical protein